MNYLKSGFRATEIYALNIIKTLKKLSKNSSRRNISLYARKLCGNLRGRIKQAIGIHNNKPDH